MRAKWSLPSDEELKTDIDNYHKVSLKDRLERYKFIWQEFGSPSNMILVGGFAAQLALDEIRLCYIEGYYLACVLLAQIFIENSLGGTYILAGQEKLAEKGFSALIDKALTDSLINSDLAGRLHQLRLMRNPYVHPKAGAGTRTIMGRFIEKCEKEGKRYESIEAFAQEDAQQAIQTVVDFLRQNNPSWTPDEEMNDKK